HDLYDRSAQRPRAKGGIYELVHRKLRSLITTKRHVLEAAAFQKCHQGDRQRGSTALRRRELHDAHRSAYRSTVNSTANKELAAAATEREEKRRNHENRQKRSEERRVGKEEREGRERTRET